MWRESGMILQTEWSQEEQFQFLLPFDSAMFDLIITNESPYREAMVYGLVPTTGETWKGADGANMRDLSFFSDQRGRSFIFWEHGHVGLHQLCKQ